MDLSEMIKVELTVAAWAVVAAAVIAVYGADHSAVADIRRAVAVGGEHA